MPQRSVASNYTFEQQRTEINLLAADFWSHKTAVDGDASTYLKHDGSNDFTGGTLAVPNAFTINSNSGNGTVTIAGNLQVNGTTTTVNTATMDVVDKNITIAKGSANDAAADGAGITIDSATDITFNFVDDRNSLVSSIGLEATTFVKGQYAQFRGTGTPTGGQGVEINAPDANTGQITSYDRSNTAYKQLNLKGSSVQLYAGTTNALSGTFSSTGLAVAGNIQGGGSAGVTGSWGQTDWNLEVYDSGGDAYGLIAGRDGAAIELRDTVTNEAFVLAANGDCNLYSYLNGDSMSFHTTDGSGTIKRFNIASDGTISKYHNATDIAAAFGGGGQVNGVTALPSMAGTPFVVAKDTGSGRSATFAGLVETGPIIVKGDNSATARFQVQTTNSSPDLRLSTWNDASGMYALLGVNDYLNANGNNAGATADKKSAGIFIDGRAGKLAFRTKHDSGTAASDRITITSSGYVTITDTPTLLIKNTSTAGNGVGGITIGKDYAGTDGCIQINSINSGSDTDHLGIEFKVHPSGSGSAQPDRKMVLDHTGKLVIGEIESTFYGQTPDSGHGSQLTLVGNADAGRPAAINLFGYGNTSNETHARINFQQQTGGTNGQTTARIDAVNRSAAEDASDLEFYTEKAGSDLKKSLVLTNKGEALLYKNASDASIGTATNLSFDSLYLGIGETEGGNGVYRTIGFGYRSNTTSEYPASMGCQITDWSGNTKAELVFATRNTTGQADVATERLRIYANGNMKLHGGQFTATNTGASNLTAARFENTTWDSNAHCRVQIATAANQGGDPYIHFDAGGSNMIIGNKWEGTNQNKLMLGPGDSPEGGMTGGLYIHGNGNVSINSSGTPSRRFNISDTGSVQIWTYGNCAAHFSMQNQSNTNSGTQYYNLFTRLDGSWDGYLVSSQDGQITLANGSDYRLKDNVVSMTNGIDIIKKLNPVTYKWKASTGRDTTNTMQGFIAHEVDEAGVIGAVDGEKDGVWDTAENPAEAAVGDPRYQGLSLERLVPSLTAALKEAIAKIETLETKVAALESA